MARLEKEKKMKYLWFMLFIAFTFTACKGKFIAEEEKTPYIETRSESCEKCGICRYYDKKKQEYRTGASCECDGYRDITYKVTPLVGHYEKEPKVKVTNERKVILKRSSCR